MSDLGPQPEPVIEPGEPNPGGVDAIPEEWNDATISGCRCQYMVSRVSTYRGYSRRFHTR